MLREARLCYSGYVDDNRATDNSWTGTRARGDELTSVSTLSRLRLRRDAAVSL